MGKKIKDNHAYFDAIMVYRHITLMYEKRTGLKRHDIEVILSVNGLTAGNIGTCIISDLKKATTGYVNYRIYCIVSNCIKKGYLVNSGKGEFRKKMFLSLSSEGKELVQAIYGSIVQRVRYIKDQVKMMDIKKGKKKASPASRVLPSVGEGK